MRDTHPVNFTKISRSNKQSLFPSFPSFLPGVCHTPSCRSHWPSDARCAPPYILHIFLLVSPPHWQWPAPMSSWRVHYFLRLSNWIQITLGTITGGMGVDFRERNLLILHFPFVFGHTLFIFFLHASDRFFFFILHQPPPLRWLMVDP